MPTATLNIECIQQINLFAKITKVRAQNCFNYSNSIIFIVDPKYIKKALGKQNTNLKKLGIALKRRVRIIKSPGELENL